MEYENGMISSGVVVGSKNSASAALSSCCMQSSTRWIPTADQITILRELYYGDGVRSPTAEQIQRITAMLRRYGRIEGKNVFYWFQNRKARERQQKRKLAAAASSSTATPTMISNCNNVDRCNNMLTTSIGVVSAAAPGPAFIDRSFRECCLAEDDSVVDRSSNNIVRVYHELNANEKEESTAAVARGTQILPLFPTHSEEQQEKYSCGAPAVACSSSQQTLQQEKEQDCYCSCHHYNSSNGAAASLELTLSSQWSL